MFLLRLHISISMLLLIMGEEHALYVRQQLRKMDT